MAEKTCTLICLHITGTPKTIYFSFVTNGKLMDFRCPNTYAKIGRKTGSINYWDT